MGWREKIGRRDKRRGKRRDPGVNRERRRKEEGRREREEGKRKRRGQAEK